jgi:hypothetical protein
MVPIQAFDDAGQATSLKTIRQDRLKHLPKEALTVLKPVLPEEIVQILDWSGVILGFSRLPIRLPHVTA